MLVPPVQYPGGFNPRTAVMSASAALRREAQHALLVNFWSDERLVEGWFPGALCMQVLTITTVGSAARAQGSVVPRSFYMVFHMRYVAAVRRPEQTTTDM